MLRDAKQRREEWIFFKIKEGDQFLGSFSPFVASSSSFQVERRRTLHKKDFREECKRAYLRHAPNANCLSFTTFAQNPSRSTSMLNWKGPWRGAWAHRKKEMSRSLLYAGDSPRKSLPACPSMCFMRDTAFHHRDIIILSSEATDAF